MSDTTNSSSYVPLDCPVCEYMMRDLNDCMQYRLTKCCVDCWVGFLEPIRKLNKDDAYLATEEQIVVYRKKINMIMESE